MRALWIITALLGLYVATVALGGILAPGLRSEFMADLFARAPATLIFHLGGGSVALVAGVFQVNRRLRSRHRRLHRTLGVFYVLGVTVAGTAGLPMAAASRADLVTRIGFGLLALCWLTSTFAGAWAIGRDDIPAHQRWMYRSYALTLAAITLRIYMPVSGLLQIPFDEAYRAVAWLCWVPNLILLESWILPRARAGRLVV